MHVVNFGADFGREEKICSRQEQGELQVLLSVRSIRVDFVVGIVLVTIAKRNPTSLSALSCSGTEFSSACYAMATIHDEAHIDDTTRPETDSAHNHLW